MKAVKKSEIWVKFFAIGCVFYCVGDLNDLQIDLHVSLHVGFKIRFAGIVPVFLEFNESTPLVNVAHKMFRPSVTWRIHCRETMFPRQRFLVRPAPYNGCLAWHFLISIVLHTVIRYRTVQKIEQRVFRPCPSTTYV